MSNIRDYISWRGDLSLHQSVFNEVDNLILSVFAYANLDGIEEVQGAGGLPLPALSDRFFALHTEKELIENLFSVLEASGAENISQIQEGGIKSFRAMLKRIENFPPESGMMIRELVNALLAGWLEQLRADTQEKIAVRKDAK